MSDIQSRKDIILLVDTFYKNLQENQRLNGLFDEFMTHTWQVHHEKLYDFWQTVILKEMSYYGKPVSLHTKMNLTSEDFELWLTLWRSTVDSLFEGKNAERAKLRGKTMSEAFYKKLKKQA